MAPRNPRPKTDHLEPPSPRVPAGYTSKSFRVQARTEAVAAWEALTPRQRGEHVQRLFDEGKLERE